MSKIITITFAPSIDKSATVPELISDKKMRCSIANAEPGGGGVNVARVINRLGGDVTAIFPSGGYTGTFFNHLLENESVPFISIHREQFKRPKVNFVRKFAIIMYIISNIIILEFRKIQVLLLHIINIL